MDRQPAPSAHRSPDAASLALRGGELWRGEHLLFRSLDFELAPGHMLLVTGPNGAGKSSLLRAVCGLIPLEAGRLLWDGREIGEDLQTYRRTLAFLGHLTPLKAELTAYENLHFLLGLQDLDPRWSVERALERLEVGGLADRPARTLSAGQRRRVALASVAGSGAPLWIMDEPYTSLDADGERLVDELLAEHVDAGGSALVASHHYPDGTRVRFEEMTLGKVSN